MVTIGVARKSYRCTLDETGKVLGHSLSSSGRTRACKPLFRLANTPFDKALLVVNILDFPLYLFLKWGF